MMFLTPMLSFMGLLIISIISAASSQTLFFLWVSLELNMVSVLPLMTAKSSFFSSEISLKYFISQGIASIFFIFSIVGSLSYAPSMALNFMAAAILFKLGLPPFHSWLMSILLVSPYKLFVLILAAQKFIPLHIFSSFMLDPSLLIYPAIFSLLVICINLKSLSSLRMSLILSAWGNTLWLSVAASVSSAWMMFLFIYGVLLSAVILVLESNNIQKFSSFLTLNYFSKISSLLNFLSLAGLPPMSGFFMKLFILKTLISSSPLFLILVLLISSLAVLFAYSIMSYYIISSPFSESGPSILKTPLLNLILALFSWLALPVGFLCAA